MPKVQWRKNALYFGTATLVFCLLGLLADFVNPAFLSNEQVTILLTGAIGLGSLAVGTLLAPEPEKDAAKITEDTLLAILAEQRGLVADVTKHAA